MSRITLEPYQTFELTEHRDDYFPIVIAIESIFPASHKGKVKKNVQFTYGTFAYEDGSYKYKYLKQKLLVSLKYFNDTHVVPCMFLTCLRVSVCS